MVFGGVGAGLYGMLVFVILTVFLAGLMVGRTPEYLGKKIESYDVKVSALAGNLAMKKIVPESGGSFPVSGVTFVLLLLGTVLIVGVLSFYPALSMGPIVEHFLMIRSNVAF